MSEQARSHENPDYLLEDDDPLAELARIVAGEESPQPVVPSAADEQIVTEVADSEGHGSSDGMAQPEEVAADLEELSAEAVGEIDMQSLDEALANEFSAMAETMHMDSGQTETYSAADGVAPEANEPAGVTDTEMLIEELGNSLEAELGLAAGNGNGNGNEQVYDAQLDGAQVEAARGMDAFAQAPRPDVWDTALAASVLGEGQAAEHGQVIYESGFVWQEPASGEVNGSTSGETVDVSRFDADETSFMDGLQAALAEAMTEEERAVAANNMPDHAAEVQASAASLDEETVDGLVRGTGLEDAMINAMAEELKADAQPEMRIAPDPLQQLLDDTLPATSAAASANYGATAYQSIDQFSEALNVGVGLTGKDEAGLVLSEKDQIHADTDVRLKDREFETEFDDLLASEIAQEAMQSVEIELRAEASNPAVADDVELDFGEAFAAELGIDPVSRGEVEGWSNQETTAANEDFARAVAPGLVRSEIRADGISGDLTANPKGWEAEDAIRPVPSGSVFDHVSQQQTSATGVTGDDYDNIDPAFAAKAIDEDGEKSSVFGGRKFAVAAMVIALFAGSIAAGYGFLGSDVSSATGGPVLIAADETPFKTKPEDPGGRVPANQDNASYSQVDQVAEDVEQTTLVSETEEPAQLEEEKLVEITSETTASTTPETTAEGFRKSDDRLTAVADGTTSGGSSTSTNPALAPRVVRTVTVGPDGVLVETPSLPVSPAEPLARAAEAITDTAAQAVQQVAETVSGATNEVVGNAVETVTGGLAPAGTTGVQTGNDLVVIPQPVEVSSLVPEEVESAISTGQTALSPIDGAISTGALGVPAASPLPKPPVAAQPAPAQPRAETAPVQTASTSREPVAKSEWVVQVSSQRTADAAQQSFENMKRRFPVMQGRPMSIQRATVNGNTFYRVRLQTASRSDANQLCSSLKAQGGACFVTR